MVPVVTDLQPQQRRPRRVNLYLDGEFTLGVSLQVAQEAGLRVGATMSPVQIQALQRSEQLHSLREAALRFLAHRPRSETEVRTRLRRRQAAPELVEEVVAGLSSQGLLDDAAFAQFWRENRAAHSPRSRRLLSLELRAKGVDGETITLATQDLDDAQSAYQAGQNKARSLRERDEPTFRKRLGDYLRRRGFSYHQVTETVAQLWQEAQGPGRS